MAVLFGYLAEVIAHRGQRDGFRDQVSPFKISAPEKPPEVFPRVVKQTEFKDDARE